jgi:DNA polymerase III alpha subunit
MKKCKIKSIKYIGKEKTYNMTMLSEQHNYALYSPCKKESFVISKNSGSYGYLSYTTAYLKKYYLEEFMVSTLNTFNDLKDFDKVDKLKRDIKKSGMLMGEKNLNTCKAGFSILQKKDLSNGVLNSIISPPLLCKGLGINTVNVIVKNSPYKDLKDLVIRTQPALSKDSLECLIDDGFFENYIKKHNKQNKEKLTKEGLVSLFESIREDSKKFTQKQIIPQNIFGLV